MQQVPHYTTLQKFAAGIDDNILYRIRFIHAPHQDQEIAGRSRCFRIQAGQCIIIPYGQSRNKEEVHHPSVGAELREHVAFIEDKKGSQTRCHGFQANYERNI